jgi:hypothetical protein
MRTLTISICFCFGLGLLLAIGCSDSGTPAGPNDTSFNLAGNLGRSTDCGENAYLLSLAQVLANWEADLEDWQGGDELDTPPTFADGGPAGAFVQQLLPVLDQWHTVLDTTGGGTNNLDTPPSSDNKLAAIYLDELAVVLGQWKQVLETVAGESFLDEVPPFPEDELAPTIICPMDTTISCVVDSTVLEYTVDAFDNCDPQVVVTCDPPSGSYFQLGETIVQCTVSDFTGNTSQCSFTVTVLRPTPPTITCPGDTTLTCSGGGAALRFAATATGDCDPDPTIVCSAQSGDIFPLGETTVWCKATDIFGNEDNCSFTVTVIDTTAPEIREAGATPAELWPPDHRMVDVYLGYDITSNEDVNGIGDGNTEPDWEIVNDEHVRLRAERSGTGSGRIYKIHVLCVDGMGNEATGFVEVLVPHDRGDDQ